MTPDDRAVLPRLADALNEVSSRLRDLGDELRTLESSTPATPPPAPGFFPPPPDQRYYVPPYAPPYAPFGMPLPPGRHVSPAPVGPQPVGPPPVGPPFGLRFAGAGPARAGGPPRPTFWDRISREGAGSRLLAWVGGGVTLAGVVLLLVLAVQRGYLAAGPRVLVGAALGAALVGIGLFLHRNPAGRIGARAVAATGVAGLYLDVIAATSIYSLLPVGAGLVVGLAVAAGGVAIAARWESQLFAVFVVACCALSAPILTHGFDVLLIGFLLVLQIATTPVQSAKRWAGLALAAGIPPVFATLVNVALVGTGNTADATTVALVCALSAVVQIAVATVTAERRTNNDLAVGLLIAAPVPALLAAALAPHLPGAVLVAGVAVLLAVIWTLQRVRMLAVSEPFAACAAAGAAVATFEALCLGFDGSARATALLGASALLAVLARQLRDRLMLVAATAFGGAGALLAIAGPLRPRYLALAPVGDLSGHSIVTAGTSGLLIAVTAVVLARVASELRATGTADVAAERACWIVSGVAALYGGSGALLSVGLAVDPGQRGFLVGHVLVTVSWTLAALVLLLRHADSTPLRVTGLALVGAALAKLVGFDLASLSGIPRVIAFLGAGLVLLAAGARYARLVADTRTD